MFRKKMMLVLSIVFVLAAISPATSFAASANGRKLETMTAQSALAYDTKLPTKGKAITEKKLDAAIAKLPRKIKGSGNSFYTGTLYMMREPGSAEGQWDHIETWRAWDGYSKNGWGPWMGCYTDINILKCTVPEYEGKRFCELYLQTKKKSTIYSWEKGAAQGYVSSWKPSAAKSKYSNFRIYPDQKVLGQKCMVFSYTRVIQGMKYTCYEWVSRSTGLGVKYRNSSSAGTYQYVYFERTIARKVGSYFKPPKGVTFLPPSSGQAWESEAVQEQPYVA